MNNPFLQNKWQETVDFLKRDLTSIPRVVKSLVGSSDLLYATPYPGAAGIHPNNIDPNKVNVLYNAWGRRMVMYQGQWVQDDPNNVVGNWMANTYISQSGIETRPIPTYQHMDDMGNYLENGKVIPPNTLEWLQARWGSTLPDAMDRLPYEPLDTTPEEAATLDGIAYEAQRQSEPSLVKIGRVIKPGDTFYINGQRAVMGSPDGRGRMQYAITEPGEGDRWKYKTVQDEDGNWVKMYYRTRGAHKEKEARLKAKGKDE